MSRHLVAQNDDATPEGTSWLQPCTTCGTPTVINGLDVRWFGAGVPACCAAFQAHVLTMREMRTCQRSVPGWRCTRERGHEGPCAAVPDSSRNAVAQ